MLWTCRECERYRHCSTLDKARDMACKDAKRKAGNKEQIKNDTVHVSH